MTVLDSSVIVDYLDGVDAVVSYVDEQPPPHRTSSICVYEVLAGEVFSSGQTDVERARQAFGRIEAIPFTEEVAVEAARLQDDLLETGDAMSPRDCFVAATARSVGEPLVVRDGDFDVEGLRDLVSVAVV